MTEPKANRRADIEAEPTTYSEAELAQAAANFDTTSWAVAGIFRESGVPRLTEDEFRAGLARWRGEGN